MKAIHTNNSTIFVSAVLFLAFAACGNVKKAVTYTCNRETDY